MAEWLSIFVGYWIKPSKFLPYGHRAWSFHSWLYTTRERAGIIKWHLNRGATSTMHEGVVQPPDELWDITDETGKSIPAPVYV